MPSLKELENSIIEQCLERDGILTLLHENKFDEAKCHHLFDTLSAYQQALGGQKLISRKMAGYLRTIETVFNVAVTVFNQNSDFGDKDHRLIDTHPMLLDLMDNIFDMNIGG